MTSPDSTLRVPAAFQECHAPLFSAGDIGIAGLVVGDVGANARLWIRYPAVTALLEVPFADLPRPFTTPRTDVVCSPVCTDLDPDRAIDSLLIHAGAYLVLLPTDDPQGTFYAVVRTTLNDGRVAELAALGRRLAAASRAEESIDSRLARLARVEIVEQMLPVFASSLDIRDVFDRVSTVAQQVIPHDGAAVTIYTDDLTHHRVHALSGMPGDVVTAEFRRSHAMALNQLYKYLIADDTAADPVERERPAAKLGFRSTVRVPLWVDGRVAGGVEFHAREPGRYSESDTVVARRLAEYIALALSHERLAEQARQAAEARERAAALATRVRTLTEQLDRAAGYRKVLGTSAAWKAVLTQAARVAETDTTVLLTGESGTGKEVVARFIYRASGRARGPFTALNCAALPEQLLESELFGFEKGAFTGATQSKPGQLEQAAGGVLFLDEVGEMSLPAQAKLLRVLEQREFQRLGGTRAIRADVRVIAATNRDLGAAIVRGTFREDLFYRLNVFGIRLPPLRDRRDDIAVLAEALLKEIGRSIGRPPAGISRDAQQAMLAYHWPGNVRELRNVLERAAILCDGGLITSDHLALTAVIAARPSTDAISTGDPAPARPQPPGDDRSIDAVEREMIETALRQARFNKSRAAAALGLTRAQLYGRLRKYGLE